MQTIEQQSTNQDSQNIGEKNAREELTIPFSFAATDACHHVPLSAGFCCPAGAIFDAKSAVVHTSHFSSEADIHVLNRWADGSVRWLLASFTAVKVTDGKTAATLRVSEGQPLADDVHSASLQVAKEPNTLTVSLPGQQIRLQAILTLAHGEPAQLIPVSCEQTAQGFQRQQWTCEFKLSQDSHRQLRATIDVWPQLGIVDVSTRLRNSDRALHPGGLWDLGDEGSFEFRRLAWNITSDQQPPQEVQLSVDGSATFDVVTKSGFQLVQYSSGGPEWNSSNHIDADGNLTVRTQGFEQTDGRPSEQPKKSTAQNSSKGQTGRQASPTVCLQMNNGALSVAVPEFWEQFPGSLSVDGSTGEVEIGLFPNEVDHAFELQGGEQKTKRFVIQRSSNAEAPSPLAWVHKPVRIIPDTDWVRHCGVIPWMPKPESRPLHRRLANYLHECTSGSHSLTARRELIDEYGWRNFGDIYADHEQTHFPGPGRLLSHYNNQFDLIFGGIQNLVFSQNPDWYDLFDSMARHVMDIDIYHTDQDRACFNGGLFWHTDHYADAHTATHRTYSVKNAAGKPAYGGGPANEHNYPTGLLYYYFLTGNQEAKESVISLADWVIGMDDGRQTVFSVLDQDDTGLASKTVFEDFHGPGRGVGNSINACLDGWLLTSDQKYLDKAEQLIQRSVHPEQDCDALHLADAEGHWSYTVCLTALGRYLHIKTDDNQQDQMYEYVRQTLVHYGQWMAENEKPSLSVPENLEYPTEAWAAQDFRKANVLRIAASCCHDAAQSEQMKAAAQKIQETAWSDLYRFGEAHRSARCFSIIMTEGLRQLFHCSESQPLWPVGPDPGPLPEWTMFELQKHRIKNTLKHPLRLMKAALNNVRPATLRQAWTAFQRQRRS